MTLQNRLFARANVVMRPLFPTRFGRDSFCALDCEGRMSGKRYATPVSYVRKADSVICLSNQRNG